MFSQKKSVDNLDFKEILFRPQITHINYINQSEVYHGEELDIEFKKAYRLIEKNLATFSNLEDENKKKALILLSEGLSTLLLIFHSSFIGYCFENTALLRYYMEYLGLSYGIYSNKELYIKWKHKPDNKFANKFTKEGIIILNEKHPGLNALWGQFSQVSHIDYKSIGSSIISNNALSIGGMHTPQRDNIITTNIESAVMLLKLSTKIFKEDFGLL